MRSDTTAPRTHAVYRVSTTTVEGFLSAADCATGIDLRDLAPLDVCEVWTQNSRYRITVLEPPAARVLIEGGLIFAMGADATLCGATAGGSLLKIACILPDFRLELLHAGRRIVTTRVRRVELCAQPLPGPF